MLRKLFIIIAVLSIATIAFASSRIENENILFDKMGIEAIITKSINAYKSEVIRLYPNINKDILDKEYSDIFIKAKNNFRDSYKKAFRVYSDDEIQRLVKFYETEFGSWLINKSIEFNSQVQSNFEKPYKELSNDFILRYYSKNRIHNNSQVKTTEKR